MPSVVYIVGNDGAGKTSYTARLSGRLSRIGVGVKCRHYYSSAVRQIVRGVIRPTTNAHGKKHGGTEKRVEDLRKRQIPVSLLKRWIQVGAIFLYQLLMALELRCRHLWDADVILLDRSFIDDLIGLSILLNIEISDSLIKFSAKIFPLREIVYVYGGHEVEYARIVDNDLTRELHRLKGAHYGRYISVLARGGVRVRVVKTGSQAGSKYEGKGRRI
jgi:hypothetical protein